MELNLIGLSAATATFLGVWVGHVSVRKIEREVERLWIPSLTALLLGIGLEAVSLQASDPNLSVLCGILGVTFLWDALEFYRQQKRIKVGHAPANPKNARHAHILATYPNATTIDWLDRNPRETPYSGDELRRTKDHSA
jgi:Domain of unknown function (DUF4491)